jgi:hypothetical protein
MINQITQIYFYIPSSYIVDNVPEDIAKYWNWMDDIIQRAPVILPNERGLCTWAGPYNWTIQTYLYLKAYNFPCVLTASFPKEGIIITHSELLPLYLKPSAKQFIVEIKPDSLLGCIFANFVIVQNRHDPIRSGMKHLLIKSAFVNYWPQAGLIPRDPTRGDRFENICFMGNREQFIENADDLALEIEKLGLNWRMVPRKNWHDYTEVDAIVAVRQTEPQNLNRKNAPANLSPNRKPASKLFNAWSAGVPAILSPEVAFQDIRKSELDFLEARNISEILDGLRQLMRDVPLRRAMMENGSIRAEEFKLEKRVQAWIEIIKTQIVPRYMLWTESRYYRGWVFSTRKLAYNIDPRLLDAPSEKGRQPADRGRTREILGLIARALLFAIGDRGPDLKIELIPEIPISPATIGISSDKRLLGVGLKSLQLRGVEQDVKPDQSNYDGQMLSFAKGGNGSKYLRSGWSQAEDWGVWSDGPIATVVLTDAALANRAKLELVIEARGFVGQNQPKQRVRVLVNGADAGELLLSWEITSTSLQLPAA